MVVHPECSSCPDPDQVSANAVELTALPTLPASGASPSAVRPERLPTKSLPSPSVLHRLPPPGLPAPQVCALAPCGCSTVCVQRSAPVELVKGAKPATHKPAKQAKKRAQGKGAGKANGKVLKKEP